MFYYKRIFDLILAGVDCARIRKQKNTTFSTPNSFYIL